MTLVLRYAARSDRGLVRSNNQDSVYAGPRLLALADGMGGHAAGEVASKVVIAALAPLDDDEPGDDLLRQLGDAVVAGNGAISELVASDPDLEGMGTTLTAVLFAGNKLGLVHIGDSRAYLVREGAVSQITHDDTFVQSLIDEGRITPDQAATHPQRSLLLRALTGHEVDPSLAVREARAGDRYLLCSDGLSGVVSEETLAENLRIPDPQACADRLIELALRGGGPDNVTCIVADVVDVDFGENAPIVGGAAGDGREDHHPPPDSPASRAGAITSPRPPPPSAQQPMTGLDAKSRRKRQVRVLALLLVVLVVLFCGAVAGKTWVFGQYYVGVTDNSDVAIFRGVQGSVVGIQLHRQVEGSCAPGAAQPCEEIKLNSLQPAARDNVRSGITNIASLDGARAIVRRLRIEQLLPPCAKTPPSQAPSASQAPSSASQAPPSAGQPTPTTNPPTTTTPPAVSAPPSESSSVDSTSLPTSSPKPGVDCRAVG